MKKITLYYACFNGGDGSVSLDWYLSQEDASKQEDLQEEGWGEDCTGSVETFEGSNIHKQALENYKSLVNEEEL